MNTPKQIIDIIIFTLNIITCLIIWTITPNNLEITNSQHNKFDNEFSNSTISRQLFCTQKILYRGKWSSLSYSGENNGFYITDKLNNWGNINIIFHGTTGYWDPNVYEQLIVNKFNNSKMNLDKYIGSTQDIVLTWAILKNNNVTKAWVKTFTDKKDDLSKLNGFKESHILWPVQIINGDIRTNYNEVIKIEELTEYVYQISYYYDITSQCIEKSVDLKLETSLSKFSRVSIIPSLIATAIRFIIPVIIYCINRYNRRHQFNDDDDATCDKNNYMKLTDLNG